MKKWFVIFICLILLTSCWSNQEIDNSLFVLGAGLDKSGEEISMVTESIKPTTENSGTPQTSEGGGNHIILEKKSGSLLNAARELIRYAKRRLYFAHTRTWVIGKRLAEDKDFIQHLDILRRNEMLRLNSYMFVTPHDPIDILTTSTLYSDLSSLEIISALEQTEFIAEFTVVKLREFFKLIEGPIPNAYLPVITLQKSDGQWVTSLEGTAVVKKNRVIGTLDINQTAGLNILLNKVKGGSLTVPFDEENKNKASINVKNAVTTITPTWTGENIKVDIQTSVEGIMGDNITNRHMDKRFIEQFEKKASQHIKKTLKDTLNTLQKEMKTDITSIGLKTYRKYPQKWQEIKDKWDQLFFEMDISISVHTNISHQGLTNDSVDREKQRRPFNNPYQFKLK